MLLGEPRRDGTKDLAQDFPVRTRESVLQSSVVVVLN